MPPSVSNIKTMDFSWKSPLFSRLTVGLFILIYINYL